MCSLRNALLRLLTGLGLPLQLRCMLSRNSANEGVLKMSEWPYAVQGPLANLSAHLSNPFGNNITKNIGRCMIPPSVDVQGIRIPLTCLWPGQQMG